MSGGGGDKVEKFLEDLNKEADQEKAVEENTGSYFSAAPAEEVLRRRAREYDDLPKHLVRTHHWLKVARALHKAKGSGLRLLTLPGRYAIEVGLYHRNGLLEQLAGEEGDDSLYVVGFETNPEVYGLLLSSRPRLLRLFDGSLVETLTNFASKTHQELVALFPFDIINLDLTVNLVAPSEGPYGPVPAAIHECFKLQGAQPHDWALMLTFRAGLPETDPSAVGIWREEYQRNLEQHVAVKDACYETYSSSTVNELFARDAEEALGQCAAKWIADQGHATDWRIVSSKHLRYQREYENGTYTIRKLVFRFSRAKLPQYAMPTKTVPTVPWHLDDLVKVVKSQSQDIDRFLERLRETKADYVDTLLREIEALKVAADGSAG
jgi:hypothetical protein